MDRGFSNIPNIPDIPYIPISCEIYDELLLLATLRQASEITVVSPEGSPERFHGAIADVYSRDGAEYLRLSDGEQIRLDRIQALDGRAVK